MGLDDDVKDVYNCISRRFSSTRHTVWLNVKQFLDTIPEGSHIFDSGCGNGRHMICRKDCKFTGVDFSDNLVKICKDKQLNVIVSDVRCTPFNDNSFDCSISIAVIHHIENRGERIKAINELLRVTKSKGQIMIQTWLINAKDKKEIIDLGNNNFYILWKGDKNEPLKRFYHLYIEGELEQEINDTEYEVNIIKTEYIKDNYCVIFEKM